MVAPRMALVSTLKDFCSLTSLHGFHYWFTAKKAIERLFWVAVVIACLSCGGTILKSTAQDWFANPTQTTINALGTRVSSMDHPAITVCKENGILDVGEYLRAVFNNFEYACVGDSCKEVARIREDYKVFSKTAYLANEGMDIHSQGKGKPAEVNACTVIKAKLIYHKLLFRNIFTPASLCRPPCFTS